MKPLIRKAVYAGLGLVGQGTDALKQLARDLAKKAELSEADGEEIARKLQAKSSQAVRSIRRMLDAEVTPVVDAIHAAIREDLAAKKSKRTSPVKAASNRVTKRKTSRAGGAPVRSQ